MSPLLRPVGPLPVSVYWVRRAVVLVAIGLATWLVISLLPGKPSSGAQSPAAATPPPSPAAAPERPVSATSAARPATPKPTSKPAKKPAKPVSKPAKKPSGTPVCPTSVLRLAVDAKTSPTPAGKPVLLQVSFENIAAVACRLTVKADELEVVVSSGKDQIWTTAHCTSAVRGGPLTLQPDKPRALGVLWMGERSKRGCPSDQQKSLPGYYAVDATFDGITSTTGRFRLS